MQPPHFQLERAVRPHILALPPYSTSTSDEFEARASILLDANENSLGSPFGPLEPSLERQTPSSHQDYLTCQRDGAYEPPLNSTDIRCEQVWDENITANLHQPVYLPESSNQPRLNALQADDTELETPSTIDSQSSSLDLSLTETASSFTSIQSFPGYFPHEETLSTLHRYPSAAQLELKQQIAAWRGIDDTKSICLGVGAADLIDAVIRLTCTPGRDAILTASPTFGLYGARAALNDVATIDSPQRIENDDFTLDLPCVLHQLSAHSHVQLIFLANPGNPTASLIPLATIRAILSSPSFHGLVVVDEAYIDFSATAASATALPLLGEFANLVVLQTLSKSLGLAGLRVGAAFGHPAVIRELQKVQMPYCISTPTMALASAALAPTLAAPRDAALALLRRLRKALVRDLRDLRIRKALPIGAVLGGNSGNFLLLPILGRGSAVCESSLPCCLKEAPSSSAPWLRDNGRARSVARRLKCQHAIAVRYVGDLPGCKGCLRVTVGREWENRAFCRALEMILGQE